MSMDEWEAQQDEALSALYSEFREDPDTRSSFYEELFDEIVRDFTDARLRSYFMAHPELAMPAAQALADARALVPTHTTGGFLFGAIAAEVALRAVLLKPILYGLVHSDTAAALITKAAIAYQDEGFTKVLLDLLGSFGGADPRAWYRVNGGPKLWDEMLAVRTKRNGVMHRAESATDVEARLAIDVAACIIELLFPAVVTKLGLHLHGLTVCELPHPAARNLEAG